MDQVAVQSGTTIERLKAHGIYYFLQVEKILNEASIICCVTGSKASAYYGARLSPSDWEICVPDEKFPEALQLFSNRSDMYEPGPKIFPQIKSLQHTYPRFRPRELSNTENLMTFFITPASEWFVLGLDGSMIERSRTGVPYPKLEHFAQNLVSTQRWPELVDLIDGMDLDEEWGPKNLRLDKLSKAEMDYVRTKNDKIMSSYQDYPSSNPRTARLTEQPIDREGKWRAIVSAKPSRIDPYGNGRERYITRYRRKGSGDPRTRKSKTL